MSAWRLLVTQLHRTGPARGFTYEDGAIQNARKLGLIKREGIIWHLTPLGVEFCEGRVVQVEARPGGRRFVATWLRSLPQGLRI